MLLKHNTRNKFCFSYGGYYSIYKLIVCLFLNVKFICNLVHNPKTKRQITTQHNIYISNKKLASQTWTMVLIQLFKNYNFPRENFKRVSTLSLHGDGMEEKEFRFHITHYNFNLSLAQNISSISHKHCIILLWLSDAQWEKIKSTHNDNNNRANRPFLNWPQNWWSL